MSVPVTVDISTATNNNNNNTIKPMTVVLHPIRNRAVHEEILDPEFSYRPLLVMTYPPPTKELQEPPPVKGGPMDSSETIRRNQGVYPLHIGRNMWTRVYDTKVSRNLGRLEFRENGHGRPILVLKVDQSNRYHKVCVNRERVVMNEQDIHHGDVLSLFGDKYRYCVKIIDHQDMPEVNNRVGMQNVANYFPFANGVADVNADTQELFVADGDFVSAEKTEESSSSGAAATSAEQVDQASLDNHDTKLPPKDELATESQCTAASSTNTESKKRSLEESQQESEVDKIQERSRSQILDELSCTICFEILVHTHVANPCGHVFCKSCISHLPSEASSNRRYATKKCPCCRKEVTSFSWAKSYDNIIWNMVLMGEIFGDGMHGQDDLNVFLRRCGKSMKDLTKEERLCIFQNCRKKRKKRKVTEKESDEDEISVSSSNASDLFAISAPNPSSISPSWAQALSPLQHPFLPGIPIRLVSNATGEQGGPAGTVEDPICLDD
ncbi:hypothetical protein CTEN210_12427 [Chaetoceros tenuissimus]|uniref:RING-type domain-containing protein n=1 Tax=Chaetoceros tenuissimus TaxID=426638 RepID=A0AAD3HA87_9STRA|nr:hypothetical protein CTEN210_12427 [Chaetoceros tenuissimus]